MTSDIYNIVRVRYAIRKLLRATEDAANKIGLTPQHHQLLLGVAGFTTDGSPSSLGSVTIGELAEFLQVRHHSVVGLVNRAQELGLVRREVNSDDRREVHVTLTAEGVRKLRMLNTPHRQELNRMRRSLDLLDFEDQRARRGGKKRKA
jgi:DNA-binding MarR family transcriptional regulator